MMRRARRRALRVTAAPAGGNKGTRGKDKIMTDRKIVPEVVNSGLKRTAEQDALIRQQAQSTPDTHRPSCLGSPSCQVCREKCVTITWSEVVTRSATVHLSDLAEAVTAPGPVSSALYSPGTEGHAMPEDLSALHGDPWEHGDLVGLLRELSEGEAVDLDLDADSAEVTSIKPAL